MKRESEDVIMEGKISKMNKDDLVKSLQNMATVFKKAGVKYAKTPGFIRQVVILVPYMSQFSIYRGSSTYEEMWNVVKEYETKRTEFLPVGKSLKRGTAASQSVSTDENPIEEK